MPTTHPRYTVTDTGDLRVQLDAAQKRWPDVTDRRVLLRLLITEGAGAIASDAESAAIRRARANDALSRISSLVDRDVLLGDGAWR